MNGKTADPLDKDPVGWATHVFFVLCALLCAAFVAWASVGRLDVVSATVGEVIPFSQVKTVQHLEGGIVREILVRVGDTVKQDQPMVVLEATASGADVEELKVRMISLRAEVARLEAEIEGLETPHFAPDLITGHPTLVREAVELLRARRQRLQNEVAGRHEQIAQRRHDIKEIEARIGNQRANLELVQEQITISEKLLRDNLTNRYNHLDLVKEARHLEGRIREDRAALQRARAAVKETEAQLDGIRASFDAEARVELETARRGLEEFTQRMRKFEDSLQRTILRSPVDGVVKALHTVTVGGVVKPGESVADVVPAGDRLIIEAQLPTQDIGYVRVDQKAVVKRASSDAIRFGNLTGRVIHVSPDTFVTDDGRPFYRVRVETERFYFEKGTMKYRLFPGMQVMVSIHTGERTVLEYLLDPFIYSLDAAMRER